MQLSDNYDILRAINASSMMHNKDILSPATIFCPFELDLGLPDVFETSESLLGKESDVANDPNKVLDADEIMIKTTAENTASPRPQEVAFDFEDEDINFNQESIHEEIIPDKGRLSEVLDTEETYISKELSFLIRVFLPNKYSLQVRVRKDGTVQDVITMTINASNRLYKKSEEQKKKENEEDNKEDEQNKQNSPSKDKNTSLGSNETTNKLQKNSYMGLSRESTLSRGTMGSGVGILNRSNSFRNHDNDRAPARSRFNKNITTPSCPMDMNSDPFSYELRLGSSKGEVDEDFPSLDRTRPIKNFIEEDEQCFCILTVQDFRSRNRVCNDGKIILDVLMPNDTVITMKEPKMVTGRQFLLTLWENCKKQVNNNDDKKEILKFGTIYVLALYPEDRERLKRQTEIIDPETILYTLDVHELRVIPKSYSDLPINNQEEAYVSPFEYNSNDNDSFDTNMPYISGVAAVEYQSWFVTKLSRNNKMSKRILGIDQLRITNSHVPGSVLGALKPIVHKTFLIENIIKVRFMEREPKGFIIQVKEEEDEDNYTIYEARYLARTPVEANQIVNKILYLIRHLNR